MAVFDSIFTLRGCSELQSRVLELLAPAIQTCSAVATCFRERHGTDRSHRQPRRDDDGPDRTNGIKLVHYRLYPFQRPSFDPGLHCERLRAPLKTVSAFELKAAGFTEARDRYITNGFQLSSSTNYSCPPS
jgi:hypothetical protein